MEALTDNRKEPNKICPGLFSSFPKETIKLCE
jgi:hypothetical protein